MKPSLLTHPDKVDSSIHETSKINDISMSPIPSSSSSSSLPLPPPPPPPPPPMSKSKLAMLLFQLRSCEASTDEIFEGDVELRNLRKDIVTASKQNFILERELDILDEKIKLLIKNRITLHDVEMSSSGIGTISSGAASPVLAGKRVMYERALYLLQSHPKFFARLAQVIVSREIPSFVQMVVFDMYGDQYDTREERLLLSLFGLMLRQEFTQASDMGSLLRANTAITQMLSAYSKRGLGLSILKDILVEPLIALTSKRELNLELNPITIFHDYIQEYETNQGHAYPGRRDLDSIECAELPEVKSVIEPRRIELINIAGDILDRICNGVASVPYGMRWVCKQLKSLSKEYFPTADKYKIGSLIGGYIYLRFFNPVIVTPDAINFIQSKPSKTMRRNLILIAKLLQNLSNGTMFGEKERYMISCNEFLITKRDLLAQYFDKLVNVDDLDTELAIDKFLERTSTRNTQIQISFNQVFLLHSLLERHIDVVCLNQGGNDDGKESSDLYKVIQELGEAPEQLKPNHNNMVGLELHDNRHDVNAPDHDQNDSLVSSSHDLAAQKEHPLYKEASALLLQLSRTLPLELCDDCNDSLRTFLAVSEEYAHSEHDISLAQSIRSLTQMLATLHRMQLLPYKHDIHDPIDAFLIDVRNSCNERVVHLDSMRKKRRLVINAMKAIRRHHCYLTQRLELYRTYLDNVRQGGTNTDDVNDSSGKGGKKQAPIKFKISQNELENMGVILSVDPDVKKAVLKKTAFTFTSVGQHTFRVTAHYKRARAPMRPIVLELEKLLDMQANHQTQLKVPSMVLNVNLLIHLINTRFLAPIK